MGNAQTDNLEVNTNHILGVSALEFDKVAGGITTIVRRTVAFDLHLWRPQDYVVWSLYVSSVTNIVSTSFVLGTDASNYNYWQFLEADGITAGRFTLAKARLGEAFVSVGNGWNPRDVNYMSVIVQFDGSAITLVDIAVDQIHLVSAWSA